MTGVHATSRAAGLVGCHTCGLVVAAGGDHHALCPRCFSPLHQRKSDSVTRATALTVAAAICYIPANALPIMTVISFGKGAPDTILSGVKTLLELGMYPIAAVVFIASIFVPMMKLAILFYLIYAVRRRHTVRRQERLRLYRLTEFVGRWSMVDIFMISLLAALVKLSAIATIEPGAGASFFAVVVVLTMLASLSFDPRLIWDDPDTEPPHG